MEQVKEIYEDDRNKKWYKGCKNNNYKGKVLKAMDKNEKEIWKNKKWRKRF